jgi:carbamoyltransferase
MNVLGLYGAFEWNANKSYGDSDENTWVHDSGCTLFIDETHICSISEERLTRIKYEGNFPINSLNYCLSEGNLTKEDIDYVLVPSMVLDIFYKQLYDDTISNKLKTLFPNAEVEVISHHLCHASSAIFSCPFDSGTFVTLDGSGSKVIDGWNKDCHLVESNSIGSFNKTEGILNFYPGITDTNGFGSYYRLKSFDVYERKLRKDLPLADEKLRDSVSGKVMGLCAYGDYKKYDWKDYALVDNYALPFISFNFGKHRNHYFSGTYEQKSAEDMAAILQKNFESALHDYLSALKKSKYLTNNVCFAGGSFLNVLGNTVIKNSNMFDNIHIPPFTNDCGLHFGAACYGLFKQDKKVKLPYNISLLGKNYSEEEIEQSLNDDSISYQKYENFEDLCSVVCECLKSNKIIGWFQGRSEYGPRSLGSRSILMNPNYKENKDILNKRVKHREYWRPFAGVVLEQDVGKYFHEDFSSPYMLYSYVVKDEYTDLIPAIIHEDKTCRVQTVNEYYNSKLTTLLEIFKKKYDIPALLNTSFNDNGEPIVESPSDAINSFKNMQIDLLVMGNYLILKKNPNASVKKLIYS